MRKILVSLGLLLVFVLPVLADAPGSARQRAQVEAVADNPASLQVTEVDPKVPAEDWPSRTFTVTDSGLKAEMKGLRPGDLVWVTTTGGTVRDVEVQKESVSFLKILTTLFVVAALLWIIAWICLRGTGYGMARFLVGRDNRYSKSKLQIALWFWTVIVAYLSTLYLRWWASVPSLIGGVDIPENLLLLSGISALSFATAKGITQGKENRSAAAAKPPADRPRFPTDLVCDDSGQPDLGDFQMVVITLIAVGVYLVQTVDFLSLLHMNAQVSMPDVDPTLLGIFGISHGTYLTKKAVSGDEGSAAGGQQSPPAAPATNQQPPAGAAGAAGPGPV